MPTLKLKTIVFGLLFVGVAGMVWGFWNHYNGLVEDNASKAEIIAQQEIAHELQSTTIEEQRSALENWDQSVATLENQLESIRRGQIDARRQIVELQEEFAATNLEQLVELDPVLASSFVNRISDDNFRLLEQASGTEHSVDAGIDPATTETEPPQTGSN